MSPGAREWILNYLRSHNTLTLASESNDAPFACSLFFANEGFMLYFVSDPKTRHAENIKRNPRVAVTVHGEHGDWRGIQGVQLEGTCAEITDADESAHALRMYSTKFAFVSELGSAMSQAKFYKIAPTWIRLIDNTRGFGFKEDIRLDEEKN